MSEKVCIFGSTGSIGCNSLNVIENLNNNGKDFSVLYLTANSNIDVLADQINKFSPAGVAITDEGQYAKFKEKYEFRNLEVLKGREGLFELSARDDFTLLISSLVGISGMEPTVNAIRKGRRIALANKETLVVAGAIVNDLLKEKSCTLLPIDSEHSAIFQCLTGEMNSTISRIILTASGGPFLKKNEEEIKNSTLEDALNHPNWNMGKKITIDSATMMNKGLEVIEAKWLFDLEPEQISIVVHPQSIVHSMVEFNDGSIKAQLGIPDMKLPIQYALTYPERIFNDYPRMDFTDSMNLTFEPPDFKKFSCLRLALESLAKGGIYPTVLNAANEIAVNLFLENKIKFNDISQILDKALSDSGFSNEMSIANIKYTDKTVRESVLKNYS
ncbi:MAG: 1-deoxy-D-xylulose-5-phosphate reductoisomerase [Bacteroidetes bacterium]|nr:1-deoxy-D-xylulose-5-phosphate reductoisomerase [Bacteroidota bacterium]